VPEGRSRVVLVGFMGSGKTAVGRVLARRLGRALEREEALAVSRLAKRVVASGGGAFAQPQTREILQKGAVTVWLRCEIGRILARIPSDGARPLAGNRDIMRALLAEREPSYRLADVAVDASAGSPREVAERIVGLIEGRTRKRTSARR
jgi:shikimate kinase